jgi:hypothetical protein
LRKPRTPWRWGVGWRLVDRRFATQLLREVVHEDPRARYRIECDDGRTSVYTPAVSALQLAPETAKRAG